MLCGTLQCQDQSRNLSHYLSYYRISRGAYGSDTCHSVIFDFGLDTQDPGYVPSGASCGAGKASFTLYVLKKIIRWHCTVRGIARKNNSEGLGDFGGERFALD